MAVDWSQFTPVAQPRAPVDWSQFMPIAQQAQSKPAQPATHPFFQMPHSVGADMLGPLEAAGHFVSGMGAQVAGGLAGVGAIPINLLRGQSLPNAVANAGNTVTGIENALTYTPRTAAGNDITNAVQYPFEKLGQGADFAGGKVAGLTGSPALGALTSTGIQALPMLFGPKGSLRAPVASDFASAAPDAVAAARAAGLKLTPTQAQTGVIGRAAESLSGHAKLERSLSRQNAQTVNSIAANEVGINGPVTADSLAAAKVPHNAVYDEVSSLGQIPTDDAFRSQIGQIAAPGGEDFAFDTPSAIANLKAGYGSLDAFDAGNAVAKVRQLRRDAGNNIGAKYDPQQQALGFAQRQIADALEGQIERHLQNASPPEGAPAIDPTLMQRFSNARQSLAKIHSVEDALKAGNGENVSAVNLGKQLKRGVPLSGGLRTVAESAQQFPRSLQDIASIRNSGPLSRLDAGLGIGAAMWHPSLWPYAAGAILGPPALRGILASPIYQRMAMDPRVPLTYARPGLLSAGGTTSLVGAAEQQP